MTTTDPTQPLDALQRVRSEKVQAARCRLAERKADLDRLQGEAQHIVATIGEHESAARAAVQGLGEEAGLTVYVRLIDALESALSARDKRLAEARRAFEAVQQELRDALADLKAVQTIQAGRRAGSEARLAWRQTRDSDLLTALARGRREQG